LITLIILGKERNLWSSSLCSFLQPPIISGGTHSWLRHYAASWKVMSSNPDEITWFFNWPNPSSRTTALGLTQPLTEMSTRNHPLGGKGRPARKTDNLTATCEPIV
jgi:hypothetical protein